MKYSDQIKAQTIMVTDEPEMLNEEMTEQDEQEEPLLETDEDTLPNDPIAMLLQSALMGEYQQWDLYTSYSDRLKGFSRDSIAEEFKKHAEEELNHIDLLQRYIVSMGYEPTVKRKSLPDLPSTATIHDIVALQLSFEKDAVSLYTDLLDSVEDEPALRVDIENILVKEQEHVHDLERMLTSPVMARVMAQIFKPTEHGEATRPQAGYSKGCPCPQCSCKTEKSHQDHWCARAIQELTPDLYARWHQGKTLTKDEKEFIAQALSVKWGALDQRALLKFLDQNCGCK